MSALDAFVADIVKQTVAATVAALPTVEPTRVLDVQQAAEYLGMRPHSVTRAIREGQLPALKVGREYRLTTTAINQAIERGDIGSRSSGRGVAPAPASETQPTPAPEAVSA